MLKTRKRTRGERKRRREWRAAKAGLAIGYAEEQELPAVIKHGEKEICTKTDAGREEYWDRTIQMAFRQNWICGCGCGENLYFTEHPFRETNITFDHQNGRGAGKRDDRIEVVIDGKRVWQNAALRYGCNVRKGSRRIPYAEHARNA
jgi:hypothetical protein